MVPETPAVLIVPVTHDALNSHHRNVFGGWILAQMDIAASIPAVKRAKGSVVTKLVKEVNFLRPGLPHDVFSFFAEVSSTGTTSITVSLEVWVERYNKAGSTEHVQIGSGEMVFVAVDQKGKPRKLP